MNKAIDGVVGRKTHAGQLRDQYLRPPANRLRRVPGGCPDACSGHGLCNAKLRQCACFSTWVGRNCGTYNYMGYALDLSGVCTRENRFRLGGANACRANAM